MRYAFVIGSNGSLASGYLKYALTDAENVKHCLKSARCGFEVFEPETTSDPFKVIKTLYEVIEKCTPSDDFVFYFSGHGKSYKNDLIIFLNNTSYDALLTTSLFYSTIQHALQHCEARNKLVILDCCDAGKVVDMSPFKSDENIPLKELLRSPGNHLVLMASGNLERTREFDELGGSFLTTHLVSALSTHMVEADHDSDGQISVQDLHKWLTSKAVEHNSKHSTSQVPYPHLLGHKGGDFILTSNYKWYINFNITLPDGNVLIVLPIKSRSSKVTGISKHPITNAQYKIYIEANNQIEPSGQYFELNEGEALPTGRQLKRSFYPWQHTHFRDANKPAVCISYYDAILYCKWLSERNDLSIRLPTITEWNMGAFGSPTSLRTPQEWLFHNPSSHYKSFSPRPIDLDNVRCNSRGLSDMIGNVWEWCTNPSYFDEGFIRRHQPLTAFVCGASFLEDISLLSKPYLEFYGDELRFRWFNFGFRIAADIEINTLPKDIQEQLEYYILTE